MRQTFELVLSKFKPLIDNASYRVNNPLGAAFVFSWVILNWEAVYYFLFSDKATNEKIQHLKQLYVVIEDATTIVDFGRLLWTPLIFAAVYIIVAPVISNLATAIWTYFDRNCAAQRAKFIENKTLITEEDRANMFKAFNGIKAQYQENINKLEDEINGLRQLAALKDEQENTTADQAGGGGSSLEFAVGSDVDGIVVSKSIDIPLPESQEEQLHSKQVLNEEILMQKVALPSNKHYVDQWLAEKLYLDVDVAVHMKEINDTRMVITELLKRGNIGATQLKGGMHYDINYINGFLVKLKNIGILNSVDNKVFELAESSLADLSIAVAA